MKKMILILLTTILLQNVQSQESWNVSDDLSISEIQEGVYLVTHRFPAYGNNSLFVHLPGNKGVLIDTPVETTGTRDLVEWINSTFSKPDLLAINTGWHNDNLGGNQYLLSMNIPVYGPELTARLISNRKEELKEIVLASTESLENKRFYESYKSLEFVPPDNTFPIEEGLNLELGGEKIEVYFPGESHIIDNTVVYLHKRHVLFGGCMVMSMRHNAPGFTEHANMKEWPGSVEKVLNKFPEAELVIPGHGPHGDRTLLSHTIEILTN